MIYRSNDADDMKMVWRELVQVKSSIDDAWIICEDFNNIVNLNDRIGSAITLSEVEGIRDSLRDYGLHELEYVGPFFIWSNKQEVVERVFSKIDRVFVNDLYSEIFHDSLANFVHGSVSDHSPCIIQLEVLRNSKPKPFSFLICGLKLLSTMRSLSRGGRKLIMGARYLRWLRIEDVEE